MPKIVDIDARREALAAAVWAVASRDGIEALTVRRVATQAGWSTGTLVHYFADKEALLVFAFELVAGRAAARMRAHDGLAPLARARAIAAEGLPLDDDQRTEARVWFGLLGLSVSRPRLAEAQAEGYRAWTGAIAAALAEAGSGGADEAASLVALVDGLAVQATCDPARWPPQRLEAVVDAHPALHPSGEASRA